jgi:hypothetical protein
MAGERLRGLSVSFEVADQGMFGILQGTFDILQGLFGILQGTFSVLQGTFGILQGTSVRHHSV